MKERWQISDFLDLEYFFIQDRKLIKEQGEAVLRERDRKLYLEEIAPDEPAGEISDRERLIRRWLRVRRQREQKTVPETLLPGKVWSGASRIGPLVVFLVMAILGSGSGYSALNYFGKEPVNVWLFFLLFIGVQVVILVSMLIFAVLRPFKGRDSNLSSFPAWFNRGLSLFFKAGRYGLENSRREQFAGALAMLQARGRGYGSLFFWLPFKLLQVSAIAFNLGVLGALLLKVAITDLAFGWQSTIQFSSQLIATLVQWLAWPWAWLLGTSAYPDLAQIEGSRMILKEGIYHLTSADLASWWPFLALAIICYCLLPRVFLFLVAVFASRRALARVSFKRADYKQLVHRLLTPRLEIGICKPLPEINSTAIKVDERGGAGSPAGEGQENPVNGNLMALVPDELFADCKRARFDLLCRQAFGYGVAEIIRIDGVVLDWDLIFKRLKGSRDSFSAFLLLQEAWQPPIQEQLLFLRDLRQLCGSETQIIVALVGKPEPGTIFTKFAETDLMIWQQKTATLGDLSLQVSPLVVQ